LQRRRIAPGIAYLEQHIFDPDLSIPTIAACAGISENYFRRQFQTVYGQSPQQYILATRLHQAKALLESGDLTTVQAAAAQVGYDDPLYFSRIFRKVKGLSPSQYRKTLHR
jgi:AraC-like DNA-binding protein